MRDCLKAAYGAITVHGRSDLFEREVLRFGPGAEPEGAAETPQEHGTAGQFLSGLIRLDNPALRIKHEDRGCRLLQYRAREFSGCNDLFIPPLRSQVGN